VKLKKITSEGGSLITTEYAGNYIYENGTLQFFSTAEGYVEPKGTGWEYVFQYKDHLGNIRLSYADSNGDGVIAQTEIREENNYYPFGLKHKGYNSVVTSTNPALKFKYNGVELEESLGMNLYEMDVRSYDPAIARFTSLDPVTHFQQSTYTAFDNNPVFWADPSGADSQTIYDFNGNAYTVDCNNGECDNAKEQTQETSGADGLTNSQWLEKFRNGFENLSIGDITLRTHKIESNETSKKCNKCFHKINLKRDSPEVILEKFIHNIAYFIEKRNQNFKDRTPGRDPVFIDELLEFSLAEITRGMGMAGLITREEFSLDDGTVFEVIVNLVAENQIVGIDTPLPRIEERYSRKSPTLKINIYVFRLVQDGVQFKENIPALGLQVTIFRKDQAASIVQRIEKEREIIRNSEN
jgi:RHS repeat-associated protein